MVDEDVESEEEVDADAPAVPPHLVRLAVIILAGSAIVLLLANVGALAVAILSGTGGQNRTLPALATLINCSYLGLVVLAVNGATRPGAGSRRWPGPLLVLLSFLAPVIWIINIFVFSVIFSQ